VINGKWKEFETDLKNSSRKKKASSSSNSSRSDCEEDTDKEDSASQNPTKDCTNLQERKRMADKNLLLETTIQNSVFRCQICFDHVENNPGGRWTGCARCHHVSQAHGIKDNVGVRTQNWKFFHICPVQDDDFSKCVSYSKCPTSLKSRHQADITKERENMKKKGSISIKFFLFSYIITNRRPKENSTTTTQGSH